MVYCGKPSKGCSACRARKVKCDLREPTCFKCEKRQEQCPGYRNLVDLMFRDESNHVIRKATSIPSPTAAPKGSSKTGSATKRASNNTAVKKRARATKHPLPSPLQSPQLQTEPVFAPAPRSAIRMPPSSLLGVLTPTSVLLSSDDDGVGPITEDRDLLPTYSPVNPEEPYDLLPSLRERGTAFFFSRYVVTDNGCHQTYDFVYDVWKPPEAPHSPSAPRRTLAPGDPTVGPHGDADPVAAGMVAVGLAGLSKLTGDASLMTHARQGYGAALTLTNIALRTDDAATRDTTMLAVLLLGTYESISGRTPQTMRAWQGHVNGAAALAAQRGTAQFRTRAGVRMFLMLCNSVLVNCVQSGLPMPRTMVELRRELAQMSDAERPAWRVAEPVYRALQVRHDIRLGILVGTDEVVEKLTAIDDEFATILAELPPTQHYRSVELAHDNPAVKGRSCHIYPGLCQVTMWNGLRTVRILVQETILEQLNTAIQATTTPDSKHMFQLAKTVDLLDKLGDAILASIPQHFGIVSTKDAAPDGQRGAASPIIGSNRHPYHIQPYPQARTQSPPDPESPRQPSTARSPTPFNPSQLSGNQHDPERFMTLQSAANTIIWPLYVLGMSSSCSAENREYILDRLDAIYSETRSEQARTVAELVRGRDGSPAWDNVPMAVEDLQMLTPEGPCIAV